MNALRKREHFIRHNESLTVDIKEDFPFIFSKKCRGPKQPVSISNSVFTIRIEAL